MSAAAESVPAGELAVHAFEIPTDGPDGSEEDGTLSWSSTTMVLVEAQDMAFDGVLSPSGGALRPDPSRPGLGLDVRWADLEDYRVYG